MVYNNLAVNEEVTHTTAKARFIAVIHTTNFFFHLLLFLMHKCSVCMHVHVLLVCLVPMEAKQRH